MAERRLFWLRTQQQPAPSPTSSGDTPLRHGPVARGGGSPVSEVGSPAPSEEGTGGFLSDVSISPEVGSTRSV